MFGSRCPKCGSNLWNGTRCRACGLEGAAEHGRSDRPDPVVVVAHRGRRYLVNQTHFGIRHLIYDTWCDYNDYHAGETLRTDVYRYRLENIPADSHVLIEEIDRYEEGVVMFALRELVWEEGTVARDKWLRQYPLSDRETMPGSFVERDKEDLGTVAESQCVRWREEEEQS
jgi:hypothetical protein